MARVAPIYPTFARGEVSPQMFGRVDIEPYSACLDKCRNCWVRPFGVVSRIAGSEYIATAKRKARLLKFVFSASDSYMIECGAGYFRFFNDGGYIVKDDGDIYEISNPFTEEQLSSIQYIQLDDLIKIVYKDDEGNTNKPLELIRKAANDWELREVEFKCSPFLDENITDTTLMASGTEGEIDLSASDPIFNSGHVGSFWWIGGKTTVDNLEKQGFVQITGYTDHTHVKAKVKWKLSTASATKEWGEGAWGGYRGYPSAIGLMDGRLYYGRTPNSPRNIYGSKPYAYEDFTPAIDNEDNGSINVEMATNATGDSSDIKWIIGTNYMLVGTYGGEFVVKGSGDAGITPTDVTARARSNWGVEAIQPIVIDSMIHFVQRTGKKVRQFVYDYYLDSYKAVDVSLFSEHLFESPIVDIAYQKNPDSILYCLREDGKVAALTLENNQQVQAWSLLEYDGVVESLETIPSYNGLYDEVYMIVKRTINGKEVRHIERIQDLITPEIQSKCWYVRSGLHYDAFSLTENLELDLITDQLQVTATCGEEIFDPDMMKRRIRAIDENFNILGEMQITEYVNANTVKGKIIKPFESSKIEGGKWGISIADVAGLEHLEKEKVQILADGAVQSPRTVESGAITLEKDAFYIIVGLGYASYIKTMPFEAGSENGTAVGKRKRVNELSMRVWRTSGCRVGYDLEHLDTVKFREPEVEMGLPQPLYTGIVPNVKYNQGWTWDANVTIEQSEPLPMNILAIAPIINTIDK